MKRGADIDLLYPNHLKNSLMQFVVYGMHKVHHR